MNENLKKYDQFIDENYNRLLTYCYNYNIQEDHLHNTYLRIRKRIEQQGFTGDSYYTYTIRGLVNQNLNEKKSLNYKKIVYIEDICSLNGDLNVDKLELILQNYYQYEISNEEKQQIITEIVRKLFHYITFEMKCTEIEIMVFKIYYLSKHKMTYEKITKLTGINKNKITAILRKIKKELNDNFINYLKNDKR